MNTLLLMRATAFSAALLIVTLATAQPFRTGGLGYAFAGLNASSYSNFAQNFSSTGLANQAPATSGFSFGGGGFALLNSKWVLLGTGYGVLFPVVASSNTEARMTQGGGHLSFGYALINKNNFLAFPAIGLGAHGSLFQIENPTTSSFIPFFGDAPANPGARTAFELGISYLDLSLHLHRLFVLGKDNDAGGVSIGLSLGGQIGLAEGQWMSSPENTPIGGLRPESVQAFYLRMNVGGGGFFRN